MSRKPEFRQSQTGNKRRVLQRHIFNRESMIRQKPEQNRLIQILVVDIQLGIQLGFSCCITTEAKNRAFVNNIQVILIDQTFNTLLLQSIWLHSHSCAIVILQRSNAGIPERFDFLNDSQVVRNSNNTLHLIIKISIDCFQKTYANNEFDRLDDSCNVLITNRCFGCQIRVGVD